jgi:hypothetical protein
MMKKLLLFAALLVLGSALSAQQSSVITIQNQEDAWFYFALDPGGLSGLTPESPLITAKAASFFAGQGEEFPFTALKPRAGLTFEGLAAGQHLLVGFFALEDKTEFPIRIISILVDTKLSQRYYGIYGVPAQLFATRGYGLLTRFGTEAAVAEASPAAAAPATTPPPVATVPAAAVPVAVVAPVESHLKSFQSSFGPASFTREENGVFSVHGLADSLYWNRDGTRVASVSGGKSSNALSLDVSSSSGFSRNVSYFFYFFVKRTPGSSNAYTVELQPVVSGVQGGIALLWKKGVALPVQIGTVKVDDTQCSVTMGLSELPAELVAALGSGGSADFTACYFDPQSATYEEFYYATLPLADILGPTR